MAELTSAPVPPSGPGDHIRGDGPEAIVYLDLACPACAAAWARIAPLRLRLVARHFPLASRRPRAPVLHAACEAAAAQLPGAFWGMWDSLLADPGHNDDPHLWRRAESLGLDLARFERDRRSPEVARRVRGDLEAAIRAGVSGAPAAYLGGRLVTAGVAEALAGRARSATA